MYPQEFTEIFMCVVLAFYGSENRRLFEIERETMGRQGKVLDFLNQSLPDGLILDVGAEDGVTASRIRERQVICQEPSDGMVNFGNHRLWPKGLSLF